MDDEQFHCMTMLSDAWLCSRCSFLALDLTAMAKHVATNQISLTRMGVLRLFDYVDGPNPPFAAAT